MVLSLENYQKALKKVASTLNSMYANNGYVDRVSIPTSFSTELMHSLRQALNYELYRDYRNARPLSIDHISTKFINDFDNTYLYLESPVYIVLKMATFAQNVADDTSFDLSDQWSMYLQDGLATLLNKLNVSQQHQEIYTINALFSDYPVNPDTSGMSSTNLFKFNRVSNIQRDVNHYITEQSHSQIAYRYGLVVPNGKNNQTYEYYDRLNDYSYNASLLSLELSLIFQDTSGLAPLNLKGLPVSNTLTLTNSNKQWFLDQYYLKYGSECLTPTIEIRFNDIQNAFEWAHSTAHNLKMENLIHLDVSTPKAVQAFYINDVDTNNTKLFTLQYTNNQTIIQKGSVDLNTPDYSYGMPNCGLHNQITISNYENNWSDQHFNPLTGDIKDISEKIVAHTQTLACVGGNQFLIGIHENPNAISKIKWADMFGLVNFTYNDQTSISLNNINQIHCLTGFHQKFHDLYRLEAATDIDHNLLVIQALDSSYNAMYVKYKLFPILKSMRENVITNINDFSPLDEFTPLLDVSKKFIGSYQGFSYDYEEDRIVISSQYAPDEMNLGQDKTIFLPQYDSPRAIYFIRWDHKDLTDWDRIILTNFEGTTIKRALNMQVDNSQKPAIFGTELESNSIFVLSDRHYLYQLIVYHWSNGDLVKQPNTNILARITWNWGL